MTAITTARVTCPAAGQPAHLLGSFARSLDVFAAHGLGGITGALLTAVFAEQAWNAPADGLIGGSVRLVGVQSLAIVTVFVYSLVSTFVLLKLIGAVLGLRPSEREEGIGMDVAQHGEEAYNRGEGAVLVLERRPTRGEERV